MLCRRLIRRCHRSADQPDRRHDDGDRRRSCGRIRAVHAPACCAVHRRVRARRRVRSRRLPRTAPTPVRSERSMYGTDRGLCAHVHAPAEPMQRRRISTSRRHGGRRPIGPRRATAFVRHSARARPTHLPGLSMNPPALSWQQSSRYACKHSACRAAQDTHPVARASASAAATMTTMTVTMVTMVREMADASVQPSATMATELVVKDSADTGGAITARHGNPRRRCVWGRGCRLIRRCGDTSNTAAVHNVRAGGDASP